MIRYRFVHYFSLLMVLLAACGNCWSAEPTGVHATYWNNKDFTGTSITRIDPTLWFDWKTGSPDPLIEPQTFSARWTGILHPPAEGDYIFYVTSDDGVRVWVDSQLLVNDWSDHAQKTESKSFHLSGPVAVHMEFYENGGDAIAGLEWSGPQLTRSVIASSYWQPLAPIPSPMTNLQASPASDHEVLLRWDRAVQAGATYRIERDAGQGYVGIATLPAGSTQFIDQTGAPNTTYLYRVSMGVGSVYSDPLIVQGSTMAIGQPGYGFLATYWNNRDFTGDTIERTERAIHENWGTSSPDPSIAPDTFSARWVGQIIPSAAGVHDLRIRSDDGVRVWIDEQLVINNWTDHGPTDDVVTVDLLAVPHDVRVDYYENYGGAMCQFEWRLAGSTWSPISDESVLRVAPGPYAPIDLAGFTTATGAVELTWSTSTNRDDAIDIQRSADGQEWAVVAQVDGSIRNWQDTETAMSSLYYYRLVAHVGAQSSRASAQVMVSTPTRGNGTGLTGLYAGDHQFSSIIGQTLDPTILFNWGTAAPYPGVPNDYFAVRWVGEVEALLSESYTFYGKADNYIRLWVGDRLVLDTWPEASPNLRQGAITMQAGVRYPIRCEMADGTQHANVKVEWSAPHHAREVLPMLQLYPMVDTHAPGVAGIPQVQHTAAYVLELDWNPATDDGRVSHYEVERDGQVIAYARSPFVRDEQVQPETDYSYRVRAVDDFGNLGGWSAAAAARTLAAPLPSSGVGLTVDWYADVTARTRVARDLDPMLDHSWPASPRAGVPADGFSAVWQGTLEPWYSEDYTITVDFDSGARVWVDGVLRASWWSGDISNPKWTDGTRRLDVKVPLQVGHHHAIRIDMADHTKTALIRCRWQSHSQVSEVIPTSQLFPLADDEAFTVAIATPAWSRTSPAWVSGDLGLPGSQIYGIRNGAFIPLSLADDRHWLAAEPHADLPPGVVLDPVEPVTFQVQSRLGTDQVEAQQVLRWQETDLHNLPYGLTHCVVRQGDSLLLQAHLGGSVQIFTSDDELVDQVAFAENGQPQPYQFVSGGAFYLTSTNGDHPARLDVDVLAVDWQGPIACHLDYERKKNIDIIHDYDSLVQVSALDPARLTVRSAGGTAHHPRLAIRPLSDRPQYLCARMGDGGPIVSRVLVEPFTLYSDSPYGTHLVSTTPDGMTTMAHILMKPKVWSVDLQVYTFTSGITLDDGTTKRWLTSDTLDEDVDTHIGKAMFQLFVRAGSNGAQCHGVKAYQNDEQVSK